jgi:hypothetical protein
LRSEPSSGHSTIILASRKRLAWSVTIIGNENRKEEPKERTRFHAVMCGSISIYGKNRVAIGFDGWCGQRNLKDLGTLWESGEPSQTL